MTGNNIKISSQLIQTLSVGGRFLWSVLTSTLSLSVKEVNQQVLTLQRQGFPGLKIMEDFVEVKQPVELLDQKKMFVLLEKPPNLRMEIFNTLASTNQYLLDKTLSDLYLHVCATEWQAAGRGRKEQRWLMPMASHLSFSFARQQKLPLKYLNLLSLAAGICLLEVLHQAGFHQTRLKWPNDIVIESQGGLIKLAGILVETRTNASLGIKWVIGMGLNISPTENFSGEIDQQIIGLQQLAKINNLTVQISRNQLLAKVLIHWLEIELTLKQHGNMIIQKWLQFDVLLNKEVTVYSASGEVYFGQAKGIDCQGRLIVKRKIEQNGVLVTAIEKLCSGEVKVRICSS